MSKFITPEQVEFSKVWNLDIRKFLPITLAESLEKVLNVIINNDESSIDKSLETLLTQFKNLFPQKIYCALNPFLLINLNC